MTDDTTKPAAEESEPHLAEFPRTPIGRAGGVLAVLFFFLFAPGILKDVPVAASAVSAIGLIAGTLSVVAMTRYRERSWMNWLGLLVGIAAVVLLVLVLVMAG